MVTRTKPAAFTILLVVLFLLKAFLRSLRMVCSKMDDWIFFTYSGLNETLRLPA